LNADHQTAPFVKTRRSFSKTKQGIGFTGALGMARGGSMVAGMNRLQLFVSRKGINSFIPMIWSRESPTLFRLSLRPASVPMVLKPRCWPMFAKLF
jgi:hypothetical protein